MHAPRIKVAFGSRFRNVLVSISQAVVRAPRLGWTATTAGAKVDRGPEFVFDDLYHDWMANVFVAADADPFNWYQIDMGLVEVGIYKVEIIKRLDRPLRFSVSYNSEVLCAKY